MADRAHRIEEKARLKKKLDDLKAKHEIYDNTERLRELDNLAKEFNIPEEKYKNRELTF